LEANTQACLVDEALVIDALSEPIVFERFPTSGSLGRYGSSSSIGLATDKPKTKSDKMGGFREKKSDRMVGPDDVRVMTSSPMSPRVSSFGFDDRTEGGVSSNIKPIGKCCTEPSTQGVHLVVFVHG
jgi:hypothetical protein